jgi:uncharacterized membrane protein
MSIYILAFLMGVVVGLRAFTPAAAVSWGASLGWLHLQGTWVAFLGFPITAYILSVLAIGELISDKLPRTPSRRTPMPFGARIAIGALCGAALGMSSQALLGGIVAGAIGALAGTLGGYELRVRLAKAIGGRDLPIALVEDAVAIAGAALIVLRLS